MNNTDLYLNFSRAVAQFVVGYHKSVVLSSVTEDSLNIINRNIGNVKNSLETIVSIFEEIRATSQNTAENSEAIDKKFSAIVQETTSLDNALEGRVKEITQAKTDSREMLRLFEDLSNKTEKIQEITGAIQDVSDRTNILAINASIEAARAGESGKGFRIIAGEVRNLAQKTGEFASDIEHTITEFKKVSREVADYVHSFAQILTSFTNDIIQVRDGFSDNRQRQAEVSNAVSQISGAVKEETFALEEGLNALEKTFGSLQDSLAVIGALTKSYKTIDTLLNE